MGVLIENRIRPTTSERLDALRELEIMLSQHTLDAVLAAKRQGFSGDELTEVFRAVSEAMRDKPAIMQSVVGLYLAGDQVREFRRHLEMLLTSPTV